MRRSDLSIQLWPVINCGMRPVVSLYNCTRSGFGICPPRSARRHVGQFFYQLLYFVSSETRSMHVSCGQRTSYSGCFSMEVAMVRQDSDRRSCMKMYLGRLYLNCVIASEKRISAKAVRAVCAWHRIFLCLQMCRYMKWADIWHIKCLQHHVQSPLYRLIRRQ